MAIEHIRNDYILPLDELYHLSPDISWSNVPAILPDLSPVEVCQVIGEWYITQVRAMKRSATGQYFTPPIVARYMASQAGVMHNRMRILDPGAGLGILTSAMCEAAIQQNISALTVVAYECDPVLYTLCSCTLNYAREWLHERGIELTFEIYQQDFVQAIAAQLTRTSLWSNAPQPQHPFDLAILNPPYFKVNREDRRAQLVKDIVQGRTNMYCCLSNKTSFF